MRECGGESYSWISRNPTVCIEAYPTLPGEVSYFVHVLSHVFHRTVEPIVVR